MVVGLGICGQGYPSIVARLGWHRPALAVAFPSALVMPDPSA
ncbi:MAG: hypothetical protein AAGA65_20270 [Actinomycetota bacterium]